MKIYLSVCLFQRSRIGYFPDSEILTFKTKLSTKPFFVKVNLICMRIINQFSTNGFGLSLALKQKLTEAWDDSEMALERGPKPIAPLKKCTLFECQGIYHESANRGYYFQVPNWKRDRHLTWSSEPREGQGLRKHK